MNPEQCHLILSVARDNLGNMRKIKMPNFLARFVLLIGVCLLFGAHPGLSVGAQGRSARLPGWWSGDAHTHGSGCRAIRPPEEMFALKKRHDLNIASVLVWGQGFDIDSKFFTAADWPGSTEDRILHYDLEVSGHFSSLMGHLVPLKLKSLKFPERVYMLPITKWAKEQGAVVGYAHANMWTSPYQFPDAARAAVPYELPIDLAHGTVDYVGTELMAENQGTGKPTEIFNFVWSTLLNSGFRLALVGGTDFSCNNKDMGHVRTWAYVDGKLTYDAWVEAIRRGETVISMEGNDLLTMTVNGKPLGSEINLPAEAKTVSVQITTALSAPGLVKILVNGEIAAMHPATAEHGATFTLEVPISGSAWIAARAPRAQTGATYLLIGGRPIRASARDAQYWADFIDNMIKQIKAGVFIRKETPFQLFKTDMAEAIPYYRQAQAIFTQRAAEAKQGPAQDDSVILFASKGVESSADSWTPAAKVSFYCPLPLDDR
jgi:hypothetical protein